MQPKAGETFLPVDLIRVVAIVLVILLHASTESYLDNVALMSPQGVEIWWASNIYDSLARSCIPLFVMLAGALLLQPSKADEPIRVFFKKRWARLGLPFIFWCIVYFVWVFWVNGAPLTAQSVMQGIFTGPYYHFWFLYLLFGLYLITPILRIALKYASRKIIKYTLTIWFIGTTVIPLLTLTDIFYLNANLFIFTGWIGYFILGSYLVNTNIKRSWLYAGLLVGLLWTIFGTYLTVGILGEQFSQFFYDGFSVNMIVVSAAVFLLLLRAPYLILQKKYPRMDRVLHVISANTLPIYLFHVIVIESLERGYFGFTLSTTSMNAFIAIPLITAVTLLICLVVILPLKRIQYIRRIIG